MQLEISLTYFIFMQNSLRALTNVSKKENAFLVKRKGVLCVKALIIIVDWQVSVLKFKKRKSTVNSLVYWDRWEKKPTDFNWLNQGQVQHMAELHRFGKDKYLLGSFWKQQRLQWIHLFWKQTSTASSKWKALVPCRITYKIASKKKHWIWQDCLKSDANHVFCMSVAFQSAVTAKWS